jgi:hypothetical protein
MIKVLIEIDSNSASFKNNSSIESKKICTDIYQMLVQIYESNSICLSKEILDDNENKFGVITVTQPLKD